MEGARALRDAAWGDSLTYSRKVFIPLTQLCRDVCHYCTFAKAPRGLSAPYLTREAVLAIARAGAEAGCKEALFTLGERPELRYPAARLALEAMGYPSTLAYLRDMALAVFEETGLFPHLNPGSMSAGELAELRPAGPSMGIMLETASPRLSERGGPHWGSPDKTPEARIAAIARAGEARVPFTSGLLIGIGETLEERVEGLFALRRLHEAHGHIQEVIIQNFRAKPDTRMAAAPEPSAEDLLRMVALARLVLPVEMSVQAPPNLNPDTLDALIEAGINDWGGISPVTRDHVNPEAPWPHLDALAARCEAHGKALVERLTVYPRFLRAAERFIDARFRQPLRDASDAEGLARCEGWRAGSGAVAPPGLPRRGRASASLDALLDRAEAGSRLGEDEIVRLFAVRGEGLGALLARADALRARSVGQSVSFVVNRNINYTNICTFRCGFCAFSKGSTHDDLRGTPYDISHEEIVRRATEAWERGASEVCLQGGIHPHYTGETYLGICRALKAALPQVHIHAFSPLEIRHGADTLGLSLTDYLERLKGAGLSTLPGTAAEILDDEVRTVICPDKLSTDEWCEVISAAHEVGLDTTSTVMFGHVETPRAWARHLLRLRDLQERSLARGRGRITEFVPLPFVHMEAPLYRKGLARPGPTFREAVLMHAVGRLVLHPLVPNVQTSWTKMGPLGAAACLAAGANDLGGTLMNESISRAAGAGHGQELPPEAMVGLIESLGRTPRQRRTDYGEVPEDRRQAGRAAAPLTAPVNMRVDRRSRAVV
ncbi:MAG: 5-amino-6-(D-ribitylamino)uracil--L-tyrosine 4-hydroxyphenyl transferase CofH [Alphaproteobacteria bacterium]|nr:5-amino-6-(D-ribitylamino)uracil--L-tyrosine 4-hydroxyphenyl transferase CofH [Alphaproteobacteria bacterium]